MPADREEILRPMSFAVQYRRIDQTGSYDPWHTMAAFDVLGAAERYCDQQSSSTHAFFGVLQARPLIRPQTVCSSSKNQDIQVAQLQKS